MKRVIIIVVSVLFVLVSGISNVASSEPTEGSQPAALAVGGERFVPIAPCRLLDTRTTAAKDAGEEFLRTVAVEGSFCGRIVPPFATAYSLHVTTYDRQQLEQPSLGVALPVSARSRLSPDTVGKLRFPLPAGSHLAVDVEGYYVGPGTPIGPFAAPENRPPGALSAPSPTLLPTAPVSAQRVLQPTPQVYSGSFGDLYLSADSPFTASGARLSARSIDPYKGYTVLQTGTADAGSSFMFFNSALNQAGDPIGQLMAFRSDGPMLLSDQVYVSGHLEYHGSNTIRTNVLNNFTLLNPRDAAGGATTRVVLVKSRTDDELGSPSTTKYEAFTNGYYTQGHVNFDSKYNYAVGSNYHFRASSANDGKETFWVKPIPAADGNQGLDTRAKMYVSGPAGFGTDTPLDAVHVKAPSPGVRVEESAQAGSVALLGNNNTDGPYLVSHTGTDGKATVGSTAHRIRFGANVLVIEQSPFASAGVLRTWTPRIQIGAAGAVTIASPAQPADLIVNGNISMTGNINAKYQDVAEWVPAAESMPAGTVVVVDPDERNAVMPSGIAYDTSVAGVVSARPGVLLGEASPSKAMIATTGRVMVRVDAGRGSIRAGDLLVTSDKPGVAMRSEPVEVAGIKMHRPGTLIGKALEPLVAGEGEILVLLSLQ